MKRTGVVTHPLFLQHDPGPWHPESPERLRTLYARMEQEGLNQKLVALAARPATPEEICWVHSLGHYDRIAKTEGEEVALDADTHTSAESFQAATLAAGGLMELTRAVVCGELDNGFALVRPPGHHAERDHAMGFCLFNNVAIAAEFALRRLDVAKVLIVDWDLHHGNGTMHSFINRREVLYFSTHQYPFYPGTGAVQDVGQAEGEGYTISVPFNRPMGDQEYRAVFRDVLAPIARQFAPDLILVSAGFDTYFRDPLGSMKMTPDGYGILTHQLMEMARESAHGRLVLTLEGGYHVEGQADSIVRVLQTLLGEWQPPADSGDRGAAGAIIEAVRRVHGKTWKFS